MSKKFLDSAGVSTLWARIKAELEPQQQAINTLNTTVGEHTTTIGEHTAAIADHASKIAALEAGTYDDTELRNLIGGNTTAIATLNGDAETAGSVAHTATAIAAAKVAEIVAGANASYDTLKEIADWILNDTTGAADMANDIAALQGQMAGIESTVVAHVAAEIEAALKAEGVDKYALASDLNALADRVKALEDAGFQNAEQVGTAIDTKITALDLANTYEAKGIAAQMATAAATTAQAYATRLNDEMDVRVKVLEGIDHTKFESAGAAAQALSDAKAYTDTEIAGIVALSTEEIDAAIALANA